MALTLVDLKEKLKSLPEIVLMETLDISSEDLVERFTDVIESQFDELEQEFQEEDSSQED